MDKSKPVTVGKVISFVYISQHFSKKILHVWRAPIFNLLTDRALSITCDIGDYPGNLGVVEPAMKVFGSCAYGIEGDMAGGMRAYRPLDQGDFVDDLFRRLGYRLVVFIKRFDQVALPGENRLLIYLFEQSLLLGREREV